MKYVLDKKRFVKDIELVRSIKTGENAKPAFHFFRELIWMSFGPGAMDVVDWWLWADSGNKDKVLRKGTLCDWWWKWDKGTDTEREPIADLSSIESLYDYISENYGKKE